MQTNTSITKVIMTIICLMFHDEVLLHGLHPLFSSSFFLPKTFYQRIHKGNQRRTGATTRHPLLFFLHDFSQKYQENWNAVQAKRASREQLVKTLKTWREDEGKRSWGAEKSGGSSQVKNILTLLLPLLSLLFLSLSLSLRSLFLNFSLMISSSSSWLSNVPHFSLTFVFKKNMRGGGKRVSDAADTSFHEKRQERRQERRRKGEPLRKRRRERERLKDHPERSSHTTDNKKCQESTDS